MDKSSLKEKWPYPEILIMVVGVIMRLQHLIYIDRAIPFASGGLFLEFSKQILRNHFALPSTIPYYGGQGIPFAYPPLPFYVEAIFLAIFPQAEFTIANLLPPLITVLTLPAFYRLTKELGLALKTRRYALFAYALIPSAFQQQVSSAGLAEAFGTLGTIWLLIALARADGRETIPAFLHVAGAGAFCIVSSPGSAYFSALVLIVFSITRVIQVKGINKKVRTTGLLLATGFFMLLLSSPYWGTVMANHGVGIFGNTFLSVRGEPVSRFYYLLLFLGTFRISHAAFPIIWDSMLLIGVCWALFRRKWALLFWFIISLAVPREGNWLVAPTASILIGIGIAEVILPSLPRLFQRPLEKKEILALFAGASLYVLLNIGFHVVGSSNAYHADTWQSAITGMEWVRANTEPDIQLAVVTQGQVREWVPHVARRSVVNTLQGTEWKPENSNLIKTVNLTLDSCPTISCIESTLRNGFGNSDLLFFLEKERLKRLEYPSVCDQVVFNPIWENHRFVIGTMKRARE